MLLVFFLGFSSLELQRSMEDIERRLSQLKKVDLKKQEAIKLLDWKNEKLECNIKEREVMGEEITALKHKLRCVLY